MSSNKGFQAKIHNPVDLRDAILAIRTEDVSVCSACIKSLVPIRIIKSALNALKIHEDIRGAPLKHDSNSREL